MFKVQVRDLSVKFGAFPVLDKLSLSLGEGVYRLTGSNGSGKSTFLKTLLGLVKPTAGELSAWLNEKKFSRYNSFARSHFSPCPDVNQLPSILSAADYFSFVSKLRKIRDCDSYLLSEFGDLLDIDFSTDQPIGTFSQGMKQKLCIASTFIGARPFLIFDESFSSLDSVASEHLFHAFPELMKKHEIQTVLFVAHGTSASPFEQYVLNFDQPNLPE